MDFAETEAEAAVRLSAQALSKVEDLEVTANKIFERMDAQAGDFKEFIRLNQERQRKNEEALEDIRAPTLRS